MAWSCEVRPNGGSWGDYSGDLVLTDTGSSPSTLNGQPITLTSADEVGSVPVPTRTGYLFAGWGGTYFNGGIKETIKVVDTLGDYLDLTAKWQKIEISKAYNTVSSGGRITLDAPDASSSIPWPAQGGENAYWFVLSD